MVYVYDLQLCFRDLNASGIVQTAPLREYTTRHSHTAGGHVSILYLPLSMARREEGAASDLVAGSSHGQLRCWGGDRPHKPLWMVQNRGARLEDSTAPVHALARCGPGRRLVAAGSDNGVVTIWDTDNLLVQAFGSSRTPALRQAVSLRTLTPPALASRPQDLAITALQPLAGPGPDSELVVASLVNGSQVHLVVSAGTGTGAISAAPPGASSANASASARARVKVRATATATATATAGDAGNEQVSVLATLSYAAAKARRNAGSGDIDGANQARHVKLGLAAAGVFQLGSGRRLLLVGEIPGLATLRAMDAASTVASTLSVIEPRGVAGVSRAMKGLAVSTSKSLLKACDAYSLTLPGRVTKASRGVALVEVSDDLQAFLVSKGSHGWDRCGRTHLIMIAGSHYCVLDVKEGGCVLQVDPPYQGEAVDADVAGGREMSWTAASAATRPKEVLIQAALRPAHLATPKAAGGQKETPGSSATEAEVGGGSAGAGAGAGAGTGAVTSRPEAPPAASTGRPVATGSEVARVRLPAAIQALACHPALPYAVMGLRDGKVAVLGLG